VINIRNSVESAKLTLAQLMNTPYNTAVQLEPISAQNAPVLYDGTPDNIYGTGHAATGDR
jgi:outer membrane protein